MRNPVLLVMSVLAGAQAVMAAGALADLLSPAALGWVTLSIAAVQAGVQFWVRGQVTPIAPPRPPGAHRLE